MNSRRIHLELMCQRCIGGCDHEHAAIQPLRTAHCGQSIADDVGKCETQALLANLHTDP